MKPNNIGNAYIVEDTHMPLIKLTLLRYESLFNCYSEEPYNISIKIRKNSKPQIYEQVMRIRKWIPNTCAYAWYIYSMDREWGNQNVIIRRVIWDLQYDANVLKQSHESKRKELLLSWPTIKSESLFFRQEMVSGLIKSLFDFDKIINNGILLSNRPDPERCSFSDLELMRRFDWGELRAIWNFRKYNQIIEERIKLIEEELTLYFEKNVPKIFQMDFDYIYPIDEMKKNIYGEQ